MVEDRSGHGPKWMTISVLGLKWSWTEMGGVPNSESRSQFKTQKYVKIVKLYFYI